MFIAHLPAGYICSKYSLPLFEKHRVNPWYVIAAGLAGALAPDLDMLYFYFVDHRQHHHHTYWSHYPIVWVSVILLSLAWLGLSKTKSYAILALVFSLNGFIHLLLDTVVGDIWWLAPFVDKPFSLFSVSAIYKPWWHNFIFHWTFLFEIAICLWAFLLWRRRR